MAAQDLVAHKIARAVLEGETAENNRNMTDGAQSHRLCFSQDYATN